MQRELCSVLSCSPVSRNDILMIHVMYRECEKKMIQVTISKQISFTLPEFNILTLRQWVFQEKVKGLPYSNSWQLPAGYSACMSNPVPRSECSWYFSREVIKDPGEIYLVTLQSHQGHWELVPGSNQSIKMYYMSQLNQVPVLLMAISE